MDRDPPLVGLLHKWRRQQEVGGGAVACDRNVVDNGDPQERFDVKSMRLGLERVPEKDDKIESPVNNRRADLLVTTERPARKIGRLAARAPAAKSAPVVPVAYRSPSIAEHGLNVDS